MTTRQRIVKVLNRDGINVALYHVEHSDRFAHFRNQLQETLMANIKHVAKPDKVRALLMWTKPGPHKYSRVYKPAMQKAQDPNKKLLDETGIFLGSQTVGSVDLSTYLQWVGQEGGQSALDKVGISGTFVMKNQALLNYFDDYSNLLIDSLDDTTKAWIASKIQYGRENFMSPDEIAQMLIDDGEGITALRARQIAVTESAKGLTTVELQAMQRYNIEQKTWHTSEDDRVEPICLALDTTTVAISKTFPGGYDGPPAHVFCRCFLDYQIPDNWVMPTDPWLGE